MPTSLRQWWRRAVAAFKDRRSLLLARLRPRDEPRGPVDGQPGRRAGVRVGPRAVRAAHRRAGAGPPRAADAVLGRGAQGPHGRARPAHPPAGPRPVPVPGARRVPRPLLVAGLLRLRARLLPLPRLPFPLRRCSGRSWHRRQSLTRRLLPNDPPARPDHEASAPARPAVTDPPVRRRHGRAARARGHGMRPHRGLPAVRRDMRRRHAVPRQRRS
ncbi:hypothetical protein PR202_ga15681 [Eleusine coracana subsp. coracana]|uniref:Uncharacterized protein n=1 Tax=Eleusine coracana subsp. coracana TaxID=191504 RepID=A0AAV5CKP4_ELECO|nr:hypothetical protein PR202_ga15681 [Eleusine coracana subsp. coracana]